MKEQEHMEFSPISLVGWSWDQKGQRRYMIYENNLVLSWKPLYVCALAAIRSWAVGENHVSVV